MEEIQVDGLRRDMLIWSSGFFPFFQFASTSVRPQIINIFQTYYLSLGRDLRQVTKAIILALLPGMEEETGDFFDKVSVRHCLHDGILTSARSCHYLVDSQTPSPLPFSSQISSLSSYRVPPPVYPP